MKSLKRLSLQSTAITDEALKTLTKLSLTQVTDRGFLLLANCSKLQEVYIWGTKISSDGVKKFKQLLPKCDVRRLPIE